MHVEPSVVVGMGHQVAVGVELPANGVLEEMPHPRGQKRAHKGDHVDDEEKAVRAGARTHGVSRW
jgi:hypothetical protein